MRKLSYAPLLAATFILWPILAFAGGLGFSALLGLIALPSLLFARPGLPLRPYILAFMALIAWVIASALWSPTGGGLVSGSLSAGNFALNAAGLRIGLTALATMGAVLAALTLTVERAQISGRVILWMLALHGLIILLLAGFTEQALNLFDPLSDKTTEAMQNILRNANAFALVLPVLAAWMWTRSYGWTGKIIAAALVVAALWAFKALDAQSAAIALGAAINAIIFVWWLPRQGFRVLLGTIAAYIALAPIIMSSGIMLLERYGIALPGSFKSRVWTWEVVIEKIREKPLIGHGMEASKTWRETYADHPEWLAGLPDTWANYPVIPGHTHNMALQLWAETGAVGALLAALSLVLLAWRLPAPGALNPTARYGLAGFIGAALIMFSFSYSVWNEAFWASLALISCAIILMAKRYWSA